LLERTIAIKDPSEAEKGGIIQFYEVCFELSWKVMKDYLESEGYIVKSPKQTLKQAFQIDLITEGELWIMALEDRNLTAHTYDEETREIIIKKIINDYFPLIEALYYRLKKEVSE
jgi:nucleotidyltransferase substrate binding protein (TIGR01987 family)